VQGLPETINLLSSLPGFRAYAVSAHVFVAGGQQQVVGGLPQFEVPVDGVQPAGHAPFVGGVTTVLGAEQGGGSVVVHSGQQQWSLQPATGCPLQGSFGQ